MDPGHLQVGGKFTNTFIISHGIKTTNCELLELNTKIHPAKITQLNTNEIYLKIGLQSQLL